MPQLFQFLYLKVNEKYLKYMSKSIAIFIPEGRKDNNMSIDSVYRLHVLKSYELLHVVTYCTVTD